MNRPRLPHFKRALHATGIALLTAAVAGCAGLGQGGSTADLGSLQQTVTAQGTRLAAVEQQVSALQTAVTQARVAPTATARPSTPTPVAIVTGIPTEGATRGMATAKVTITEYSDYL